MMSKHDAIAITAPPLLPGDTIGFMAPSNRVDKDLIQSVAAMLKARGYDIFIHPQTWSKQHQSAGSGQEKADALHELVKRKDIKAVIFARGGNRAGTMLEHLDFKLIARYPKLYMGYSDVTVLLNAIQAKTGIVTYHGPMLRGLISLPKKQIEQCFSMLAGQPRPIEMPKVKLVHSGSASGRLMGGNLSLLCSLLGTAYEPDFKNAILFIEDVNEESSAIDRNLWHLRNAGILKGLKGIILGSFTDTKDTGKTKFGFKFEDSVREVTEGYDYPVFMNAPFGHGKDLYTFPIGKKVHLQTGPIPILTL